MCDEQARVKKPRGRRPKNPDLTIKPRCIRLSDRHAKLLRMWGRGDLTAGLRWLIEQAAPFISKPGREQT